MPSNQQGLKSKTLRVGVPVYREQDPPEKVECTDPNTDGGNRGRTPNFPDKIRDIPDVGCKISASLISESVARTKRCYSGRIILHPGPYPVARISNIARLQDWGPATAIRA